MICNYIEKGIRLKLFSQNNEQYIFTKPCCHMPHEEIPEEHRKFIKLDSLKVSDIMNAPSLKYFREYFEENQFFHPACESCQNYEAKGMESPRTQENKRDYSEYDISRLDVVLSNSCNLACPFCSSHASSLIDKLSNTLEEKPQNWIPIKESHDFEQPKDTETSELIATILKNYRVHTLKLIGGEPFLKENWSKISETINSGEYSNLNIDITTNGTVITDEIIDTLQKLKSFDLKISIDSIGKNYEFIRWPHTWERMKRNLDYLKSRDVKVTITNLINIFNFEYLPEIEEYFDDANYSCEIQPESSLHNFRNLPPHIIEKVRSQIKSEYLKKALIPLKHNHSKDSLRREFEVLLKQRKMKADDVIGPMTREYFNL